MVIAEMNITQEELDDIRNGTQYTNIRLSKASGNNGQWVRMEGEFKTSLKQRLQKRIVDTKRRMEGGSKAVWNQNNHEKLAIYDINNKARRIEKEGDDYWIKNAEQAMRWRANNPDKIKIINNNKNNDPYSRLYSMKYQANIKGRKWLLSDEDALCMINSNCYYCGEVNESSCNSIDRLDSDFDYTLENCVASCRICNYMKNTLNLEKFLKSVEHICAYNNLSPTAQTNNSISNYISSKYTKYCSSAKYRNYDFKLSKDEFDEITRDSCYICGIMNKYDKYNKPIHRNGIDRKDNNIGYIKENCKACCTMCNYFKRDVGYDIFMQKIKKNYEYRCIMYNNQKADDDKTKELDEIWNDNPLIDNDMKKLDEMWNDVYNRINAIKSVDDTKINKSADDKREQCRLHKQTYRQKQRENMGDEAYKRMRAMEKSKERNNGMIKENKHKKTPEEIKEEKRVRIAAQRQQMREKYGDEEYRKMMASERAKNRAKLK